MTQLKLKTIIKEIETSLFDTWSKQRVTSFLYKLAEKYTKNKLYSDEYWTPVHSLFKDFERSGIKYHLTSSGYNNSHGNATRKEWHGEIHWTNNKGKEEMIYFIFTAAGAGSVQDPMDKYDLTTVFGR